MIDGGVDHEALRVDGKVLNSSFILQVPNARENDGHRIVRHCIGFNS